MHNSMQLQRAASSDTPVMDRLLFVTLVSRSGACSSLSSVHMVRARPMCTTASRHRHDSGLDRRIQRRGAPSTERFGARTDDRG